MSMATTLILKTIAWSCEGSRTQNFVYTMGLGDNDEGKTHMGFPGSLASLPLKVSNLSPFQWLW